MSTYGYNDQNNNASQVRGFELSVESGVLVFRGAAGNVELAINQSGWLDVWQEEDNE